MSLSSCLSDICIAEIKLFIWNTGSNKTQTIQEQNLFASPVIGGKKEEFQ